MTKVKYTQDTLHTQLPVQFQQVWELYRILKMQLEQYSSSNNINAYNRIVMEMNCIANL